MHIHSDIARALHVKCGCGNMAFMHFSPNESIKGEEIDCQEGWARETEGNAIIGRKGRPVQTAVRSKGAELRICRLPEAEEGYGTYAILSGHTTDMYVMFGFAETEARALEIAASDPVTERDRVVSYYSELLSHWKLQTPDPDMNEAFDHALLNVEYAWLRPYGWIESIHHWPTMWHMEHTAAEEWNERYDRVRETLRSQMKNVYPNGAIPDMCATGKGRRDWGGNNQFFLREVVHYLQMTGDMAFAAECEPYMEKAWEQTRLEYDPVDTGVIAWGTQIGNQEDMESTPGPGAATGIEGVQMLRLLAYVKNLLGKEEEAARYCAQADWSFAQWYRLLWQKDLGRPAWYIDTAGEKRLETTYHGIVYPVIYEQLDDADAVSALDHLLHRMCGPEGEIYQSNHFGDHAYEWVPTWGMQFGSDMQPFATAALVKTGRKNEAIRPLESISRRVCGSYQRGSWPETANEKRFAYFSPSAAVFSQAVIESVFGLARNIPENSTTITPSIPDSWPNASLKLPGVEIEYKAAENGYSLYFKLNDSTRKRLCILCPPSSVVTLFWDGKTVTKVPEHHCGWSRTSFELGTLKEGTLQVSWIPIGIECSYAELVACGDSWTLEVAGDVALVGLDDRCGVLRSVYMTENRLQGTLREELLDPYLLYGDFGQVNFARRTIFLRLRYYDTEFLYPCHITVLPKIQWTASADRTKGTISVTIANHMAVPLTGGWQLRIRQNILTADRIIPAGETDTVAFSWDPVAVPLLNGKNSAQLITPLVQSLEIEADISDVQCIPVPLPEEMCRPAPYWRELGIHPHHGCIIQGPDGYMQGLWETVQDIDILPPVPLRLHPAGFVPFSRQKHPVVILPVDGIRMRKLYILCSAFIQNQDAFSRVARVEIEAVKEGSYIRPVFGRDLYFPGDLDMGYGNPVIAGFATYVHGVSRVKNILPIENGDYADVQPPLYPKRTLWCRNRAADCCNTVMNLLEFDFGREVAVEQVRIYAGEADSAGAILAMAAEL